MIALCFALVGVNAVLAGFLVTIGIWLHSANEDRLHAADLIDGQRKLVAEYKSKYDLEFVAHGVTQRELEQERQLRAVAEAQRNEAQRKARAFLSKTLTNEELAHVMADLFATPLAVVPISQQPGNELMVPE